MQTGFQLPIVRHPPSKAFSLFEENSWQTQRTKIAHGRMLVTPRPVPAGKTRFNREALSGVLGCHS
jgi:hypothetical protein